MRIKDYLYATGWLVATGLTSACQQEESVLPARHGVKLTMSLSPFEGDMPTRTSEDGQKFENGDQFRMKIICPHTTEHQAGESWGSGYYTFTIGGESGTYISGGQTEEAQATTYVYTAQNSTGTRIFVVGKYRYSRPSNFFCADQSKLTHFKQSDVVWAQAIRQTGAQEVHLNFKHKVARLDITLVDNELTHDVDGVKVAYPLSASSVLTLEGMPDIDGAEIVVGDYYADQYHYDNEGYTYKQKASCSYENNGKVLGIEVIEETQKRACIALMTGSLAPGGDNSVVVGTVPNTGTYTAYHKGSKQYSLYVPPCVLSTAAVCWVRDGERRYSATLPVLKFEEGKVYPVRLTLKNPSAGTGEGGEGGTAEGGQGGTTELTRNE